MIRRMQTSALLVAAVLALAVPTVAEAGYPFLETITSNGGVSAKSTLTVPSGRYSMWCEQAARGATGPAATVVASQTTGFLVEAGQRLMPVDLYVDEGAIAIVPAVGTGTTKCHVYKRTGNLAVLEPPAHGEHKRELVFQGGLGAPPVARLLWSCTVPRRDGWYG